MEIVLFLAAVFVFTLIIGRELERIRIPWIFASLLLGLILAAYNPFIEITSSEQFTFLANLGMYLMLAIIGFELDLDKVKKSKFFILKTTTIIIFAEALIGSLAVHYIFGLGWIISVLLATSFATVGEAVLLPILDEFKLTKTKLGQTIISIGVLDNVFEVLMILVATIIIGHSGGLTCVGIGLNLLILVGLFVLLLVMVEFRKYFKHFTYKNINPLFLFVMFFIFSFIGLGQFAHAGALGALLAGIALREILSDKLINFVDSEIRTMAYGFFAPIFFLWVGLDVHWIDSAGIAGNWIWKFLLLSLFFIILVNLTKISSAYIAGRKYLGSKKSILLGIGLCVKFSTSIVIIKMLYENNLIPLDVYSIFIGTTIFFKFIVPFLFSHFITKWRLNPE